MIGAYRFSRFSRVSYSSYRPHTVDNLALTPGIFCVYFVQEKNTMRPNHTLYAYASH